MWGFLTDTDPQALTEVQQFLDAAWSAHPEVSNSVRSELSIATAEVVANIIEHATDTVSVLLRMELQVLPTEVNITFTHDGLFYATADLNSRRGIALARSLLSVLSHRSDGGKHHWTLVSKPL